MKGFSGQNPSFLCFSLVTQSYLGWSRVTKQKAISKWSLVITNGSHHSLSLFVTFHHSLSLISFWIFFPHFSSVITPHHWSLIWFHDIGLLMPLVLLVHQDHKIPTHHLPSQVHKQYFIACNTIPLQGIHQLSRRTYFSPYNKPGPPSTKHVREQLWQRICCCHVAGR